MSSSNQVFNSTHFIQNNMTESTSDNKHKGKIYSLALLPHNLFASGSEDKKIKIWDYSNGSGKFLHNLEGHNGTVFTLMTLNNYLVSGSEDRTIKIWDIQNQKILKSIPTYSPVTALVSLSDGRFAAGLQDGKIKIFDSNKDSEKPLRVYDTQKRIFSLTALSNKLISGLADKTIGFFDLTKNDDKPVKIIQTNSQVNALIASKDQLIISGHGNGQINIWDLEGECKKTLEGHKGFITNLLLSSDNRLISTSSNAEKPNLVLWDMKDQLFNSENITLPSLLNNSYCWRVGFLALANGSFAYATNDNNINFHVPKALVQNVVVVANTTEIKTTVTNTTIVNQTEVKEDRNNQNKTNQQLQQTSDKQTLSSNPHTLLSQTSHPQQQSTTSTAHDLNADGTVAVAANAAVTVKLAELKKGGTKIQAGDGANVTVNECCVIL